MYHLLLERTTHLYIRLPKSPIVHSPSTHNHMPEPCVVLRMFPAVRVHARNISPLTLLFSVALLHAFPHRRRSCHDKATRRERSSSAASLPNFFGQHLLRRIRLKIGVNFQWSHRGCSSSSSSVGSSIDRQKGPVADACTSHLCLRDDGSRLVCCAQDKEPFHR